MKINLKGSDKVEKSEAIETKGEPSNALSTSPDPKRPVLVENNEVAPPTPPPDETFDEISKPTSEVPLFPSETPPSPPPSVSVPTVDSYQDPVSPASTTSTSTSTQPTTTTTASSESQIPSVVTPVIIGNGKDAVLMRLSNRVKILELNMTLSSQYLEKLSQHYK